MQINTIKRLVIYLCGFALTVISIAYFGQLGLAKMIFGDSIAYTYIYPTLNMVLQWIPYLAIPTMFLWGIVSYFLNRGKSDEIQELRNNMNIQFGVLNGNLNRGFDEVNRNLSRMTVVIEDLVTEIRKDRESRQNGSGCENYKPKQ